MEDSIPLRFRLRTLQQIEYDSVEWRICAVEIVVEAEYKSVRRKRVTADVVANNWVNGEKE